MAWDLETFLRDLGSKGRPDVGTPHLPGAERTMADGSEADVPPLDGCERTSAGGVLRFQNRHDGPPDQTTALIWDAATGVLLVDGSLWTSSLVVEEKAGRLLLALRQRDRDALFRIDPAAQTFRVIGEPRVDRPLGELSGAVQEAMRACLDKWNAYCALRLAPDSSVRVELVAVEWSNSHWVNSPRITEVESGRILLDLWNTDWDAEISFPHPFCVGLDLRRYSSRSRGSLAMDVARGRFALRSHESRTIVDGPITDVRRALEALGQPSSA